MPKLNKIKINKFWHIACNQKEWFVAYVFPVLGIEGTKSFLRALRPTPECQLKNDTT